MPDPIDEALMSKEAIFGQAFRGLAQGLRQGRGLFSGAAQDTARQFGSSLMQGVGESGRDVGKALLTGAAGAIGAGAIAGAGAGVRKLTTAATKRRDFREMMDLNPDLYDRQKDNPKFFNASYSSLRRLNPSYGKDPVVAGSVMRRMLDNPESAGTILTGTMKDPAPPPPSTELSVGGEVGPLQFRHRI